MKKIIFLIIIFFSLMGCTLDDIDNTPTKQVEAFFNNYQTLNHKVLDDLDLVIAKEQSFNKEQKLEYREILKKHYQNLSYEIKDETVNGDKALVEAEIDVTDFNKVLNESREYLNSHRDEFIDNQGNYDDSKYIDFQLKKMKQAKDKVKYTLNLSLTKNDDGDWYLNDISDEDEEKILGIYEY